MRRSRWIVGVLIVLVMATSPWLPAVAQDASPVTVDEPVSTVVVPDSPGDPSPSPTTAILPERTPISSPTTPDTNTSGSKERFQADSEPSLLINGSSDDVVYVDPHGTFTMSFANIYVVENYPRSNCVPPSSGGWYGPAVSFTDQASAWIDFLVHAGDGGFVMSVQGRAQDPVTGGFGATITTCRTIVFGYPPPPTATATATNTATSSPTSTATSAPTETVITVPVDTATTAPTNTATSPPTSTATTAPTNTATSASTSTATTAPTNTAAVVATATATTDPTAATTLVPIGSATVDPTETATIERANTATMAPTQTPTTLPTSTATIAPTGIATVQPTQTVTTVPTSTPTPGRIDSATGEPTGTSTAIISPTISLSATREVVPNGARSATNPVAIAALPSTGAGLRSNNGIPIALLIAAALALVAVITSRLTHRR